MKTVCVLDNWRVELLITSRHFLSTEYVALKNMDRTLQETLFMFKKRNCSQLSRSLFKTFPLTFQVKNCISLKNVGFFFYVLKGHLCHDGNNGPDAEKWLSAPIKRIEWMFISRTKNPDQTVYYMLVIGTYGYSYHSISKCLS